MAAPAPAPVVPPGAAPDNEPDAAPGAAPPKHCAATSAVRALQAAVARRRESETKLAANMGESATLLTTYPQFEKRFLDQMGT